MRRLAARTAMALGIMAIVTLLAVRAARADAILDGNALLLDAIRASRAAPPAASRFIAILNVAMFDSVNAASGMPAEPYSFEGMPPADADPSAAAAAAAYGVIAGLFPELNRTSPTLARRLKAMAPGVGADHRKAIGAELGRACAEAVLASRVRDGASEASTPFPGATTPGAWRPAPPDMAPALLAGWGKVRPWAVPSVAEFAPAGPPPLGSVLWLDSFNAVKSVGTATSAAHTAKFGQTARFWADIEGTETPPGHWILIASSIADAHRQGLVENARLFALLAITLADTAEVVWAAKYRYAAWRPITAVREAARLGIPHIAGDANWQPALATPPFPEYPSGHSAFSAAAARLLGLFFGTDHLPVDVTSRDAGMATASRHFDRVSDAAEEAGISRIYGGIHFYFSHIDGAATGRRVAEFIYANRLQPRR